MGRFINADALILTEYGFVGFNQFAYCINNPVRYHDVTGYIPEEDCINDDPEEQLFPDKDALGAPPVNATSSGSNPGYLKPAPGASSMSGTGHAPKQGQPGSVYSQISSDGTNTLISQTMYDGNKLPVLHIDYVGRSHDGIPTPHVHLIPVSYYNGNVYLLPTKAIVLPLSK